MNECDCWGPDASYVIIRQFMSYDISEFELCWFWNDRLPFIYFENPLFSAKLKVHFYLSNGLESKKLPCKMFLKLNFPQPPIIPTIPDITWSDFIGPHLTSPAVAAKNECIFLKGKPIDKQCRAVTSSGLAVIPG
jgi:hypothetical protein